MLPELLAGVDLERLGPLTVRAVEPTEERRHPERAVLDRQDPQLRVTFEHAVADQRGHRVGDRPPEQIEGRLQRAALAAAEVVALLHWFNEWKRAFVTSDG